MDATFDHYINYDSRDVLSSTDVGKGERDMTVRYVKKNK